MKPRRKKKKQFVQVKLLFPVLFFLAVIWVWKSNEADRLSRQLTQLERAKKNLAEQNRRFYVELEKYRSIAWIDNCVRQNYGMTYDVKKRIVLFDKTTAKQKIDQSLFASVGSFLERVFDSLLGKR
ncbi:MAG: hypothetical protein J7K40_04475 [candidate division Zixibacteria bacterium]|nr:hypothetical protein [candidate division Zixibacteria bacterium]